MMVWEAGSVLVRPAESMMGRAQFLRISGGEMGILNPVGKLYRRCNIILKIILSFDVDNILR